MNDNSEQTIRVFGKRSSLMVNSLALVFALLGASTCFYKESNLLWAIWIPLCFLVIPPLHYLCREFLRLQDRVRELEKTMQETSKASGPKI
jgi:hypothetical protein